MKNRFSWIFGIMLMIFVMNSCIDQMPVDSPDISEDAIPLQIYGEIKQISNTRVSDTGFADGDAVGIFAVNYEGRDPGELKTSGNQADNIKYVLDEGLYKWNSTIDAYYKDKKTPVDLYGYYPYGNPSPIDNYVFELAKDQSQPAENGRMGGYEASDFLWGKAENVSPTAERVPIRFNHIMAGVVVELAEGAGFDGEWTTLEKAVLITGISRKAAIDLKTGIATATGNAESTGTIPYKDGNTFRAVIAPQSVATGISLFSITVDGTAYKFSRSEQFTYNSGKLHKFTITVNKKTGVGIEFVLSSESITAWENDKISHDATAKEYVVVHSETPGSLKAAVIASGKDYTKIKNLKVTGAIDWADYAFMKDEMTVLQAINLKEVESCKQDYGDGKTIYSIPVSAFQEKKSLINFIFPDKLTIIEDFSFYGTNLSGSLIIPDGVERIGPYAFDGLSTLTGTLSLPSTLKVIESGAFGGCSGLIGELKLPTGLQEIQINTFYNCPGFSGNLILPDNLQVLGYGSFQSCTNFTGSLKIPSTIKEIGSWTFYNTGFNGQLQLHNDITTIDDNAFSYSKFRGELILPSNIAVIGENTFAANLFSGTLQLPPSLTVIKARAFSGNARLTGIVEIPEGINAIGTETFSGCSQLEGVILPKSVESINDNAFGYCYQLNKIVSKAVNPPRVNPTAFDGVAKDNFTVEVPDASVASYQTAVGWNEFKRISAYRDFSISRNTYRSLNASSSKTLTVRALNDASWSIESKPEWVTVSTSSGTGKEDITITVAEQTRYGGNRTGEVVFKLDNEEYRTRLSVEQYDYDYGDGDVLTLQKATKGIGVNIVLMGDCFDALDISSGNYLNAINEAYKYFFEVEPYKSYKAYFNVYAVFGVSPDRGVGSVNTIREAKFGTSYFEAGLSPDAAATFSYATKAPINNDVSNTLVLMVINSEEYSGVTYMWGDGSAIALCPMSRDYYPYDFRGIVQHEAGGHGFGKLGDEYMYVNAFVQSCNLIHPGGHLNEFNMAKSFGWYKNLSLTGNMYEVPWSHLIFHPTYSDKVDVYEGGFYHTRGVFRSEPNSCMNNNIPYYNAISRQAIVEYIKQHAGETFSLDDFYANDVIDAASLTRSVTTLPSLVRGDHQTPRYMGGKPNY